MKAYIIHGWSGFPEEAWFPWLKKKLEEKGFQVEVPQMPNPDEPNKETWVAKLQEIIQPDEETFLIGHSIGCQTIMRYLETQETKIGGILFVAGFFNLIPGSLGGADEDAIAKPWLESTINTDKVKLSAKKIAAIFSDNDPFVPISDSDLFEQRLGAQTLILEDKGHMGHSEKCTELPEALEIIEEMMK